MESVLDTTGSLKPGFNPILYGKKGGITCGICSKIVANCALFRHQLLQHGGNLNFQPPQEVIDNPVYFVCFDCSISNPAQLKNYLVVGADCS